MKLQELLFKHKDKLWGWIYRDILLIEDICYCWYTQEDGKLIREKKSLSDLLFSTNFLSLLEWKKNDFESYMQNWNRICDDFNIHKINLVLLNTDEERIKYIEAFTL